MRRLSAVIATAAMLISQAPAVARAVFANSSGADDEVTVTGYVEHIYAPRLFTVAPYGTAARELLVIAPAAVLTPRAGTLLVVRGVFRDKGDADFEALRRYEPFDTITRERFARQHVLIARSFAAANARELPPRTVAPSQAAVSAEAAPPRDRTTDLAVALTADALADVIDTIAGRTVRLQSARVVGVFDPRVFLIESQVPLRPIVDRNRVLVFIDGGTLRVDPATLVASSVTIAGVARTLLGMKVGHDVPWPAALNKETVQRLEIRAAILARSVRTPEGVDLVVRSSSTRSSQ